MGNICILTGKTTQSGFTVSHSNRHIKRKVYPNIQKRRLLNPADGLYYTVKISTGGLRTIKKWQKEGKTYDLRTYEQK